MEKIKNDAIRINSVREAYNEWAAIYDTNSNRTRDLEGIALRETLDALVFHHCLEIGCGTGKNTEWLVQRVESLLSIDMSEQMLDRAKDRIRSEKVRFLQADVTDDWDFTQDEEFDSVVFSLVLEHIEDLERIFENLGKVVKDNGYVYVGELHPFKQYIGTRAGFDTKHGPRTVPCFNHHVSDFTGSAGKYGFEIIALKEYFDGDDRETVPRILTLLFRKLPGHTLQNGPRRQDGS